MSVYSSIDPADYRGGELEAMSKACMTCQEPDGSPNVEYLNENGSCTFGCGARISNDSKTCFNCQDHSANAVECESCSKRWERWSDKWEVMP